jgi:hypothetical protein
MTAVESTMKKGKVVNTHDLDRGMHSPDHTVQVGSTLSPGAHVLCRGRLKRLCAAVATWAASHGLYESAHAAAGDDGGGGLG